jgi:serine/threonine protein kinase
MVKNDETKSSSHNGFQTHTSAASESSTSTNTRNSTTIHTKPFNTTEDTATRNLPSITQKPFCTPTNGTATHSEFLEDPSSSNTSINSSRRYDVDFSFSSRSRNFYQTNTATTTTAADPIETSNTPIDALIPFYYPHTATSKMIDDSREHPIASPSLSPTISNAQESNQTAASNQYLVSEDSERQILLLMLLAQVCALHDATPRTFIVHVLSLYERGILDHQSIRFLFDLDLVPQDALVDFDRVSATFSNTRTTTIAPNPPIKNEAKTNKCNSDVYRKVSDAIVPYNTAATTASPTSMESKRRNESIDSSTLLPKASIAITANTLPQEPEAATALQEYLLERKVREASVSAIRKVLERHDSNDFSTVSRQQHTTTQTSIPNSRSSISTGSYHQSNSGHRSNAKPQDIITDGKAEDTATEPNNTISKGGEVNDSSLSVISVPAPRISTSSWAVEHHPLSLSRYQRDFTQIKKLASGSFGEVFHVINKLDSREYAMKRVMFTAQGFSNDTVHLVLREVRCLAQCDHPNCVRYYTSWLEPSWMTGSGIPVSTPDQIVGVTKSTQQQVLTDIHQLVVLSSAKDLHKPKGLSEDEILVNQHLQHIDELLFGGRHHLQLLKPTMIQTQKQNQLLLPSPPHIEKLDDSLYSGDFSEDDDSTIGRDEYYHYGGSSIGFTFQQSSSSKGSNEPKGHSTASEAQRLRDQNQEVARHTLLHARNAPYASRYNYHICLYIQMQLCHSKTLSDWIQQRNFKAQEEPEAVDIHQWALDVYQTFRQIVSGLAHVHGKGIIHRDLKPANIFAADDGVFKIGDFGLSKLLMFRNVSCESHLSTPTSGVIPLPLTSEVSPSSTTNIWSEDAGPLNNTIGVGTLTYASPEQLRSHEYCSKADIFSLGLILLELCSNFVTDHERAQAFHNLRLAQTVPRKIERLFPRAAKLILACTDPEPKNRPSANDILSDDILLESNTEILRLKVELRKMQSELDHCKAMLFEKDSVIDDLRLQLKDSEVSRPSQ